ncbi:MAG: REP-associated tyrosine transposase [Opitutales bacterium]
MDEPGNADVPVGPSPHDAAPGRADVPVGSSPHDAVPGNADVPVGSSPHDAAPGNADVPVGPSPHDADGDVGAPGTPPRGWYTRGYLPHRDDPQVLQSITFRLADSLPQEKLKQLENELERLPVGKREIERRKQIETWLDAGMGCCALKHPKVALYVQNAFRHFHHKRYQLHAWCIMPNHVHVLIDPLCNLALIVQGWKSFTGRWALRHNAELELGIPGEHFWMRDYWDRFIRDAGHYRKAIDYIHENPVTAGLCRRAEDWPWSSACPGNATFTDDAPGAHKL